MEAANHILTLNMVTNNFQDPGFLQEKGFKVVHITRLQAWVMDQKQDGVLGALGLDLGIDVPMPIELPPLKVGGAAKKMRKMLGTHKTTSTAQQRYMRKQEKLRKL